MNKKSKIFLILANIQKIDLPSAIHINSTFYNNRTIISGFGRRSDASTDVSILLQWVTLRVIPNQECQGIFNSEIITSDILCTRGFNSTRQSPCNGDTGGPLILNENNKQIQIGIVSFISSAGCSIGNPAGFIRTASYLNWIEETINSKA